MHPVTAAGLMASVLGTFDPHGLLLVLGGVLSCVGAVADWLAVRERRKRNAEYLELRLAIEAALRKAEVANVKVGALAAEIAGEDGASDAA
jgi:hypothetical protein